MICVLFFCLFRRDLGWDCNRMGLFGGVEKWKSEGRG